DALALPDALPLWPRDQGRGGGQGAAQREGAALVQRDPAAADHRRAAAGLPQTVLTGLLAGAGVGAGAGTGQRLAWRAGRALRGPPCGLAPAWPPPLRAWPPGPRRPLRPSRRGGCWPAGR